MHSNWVSTEHRNDEIKLVLEFFLIVFKLANLNMWDQYMYVRTFSLLKRYVEYPITGYIWFYVEILFFEFYLVCPVYFRNAPVYFIYSKCSIY